MELLLGCLDHNWIHVVHNVGRFFTEATEIRLSAEKGGVICQTMKLLSMVNECDTGASESHTIVCYRED